jgi:hypothetical protein
MDSEKLSGTAPFSSSVLLSSSVEMSSTEAFSVSSVFTGSVAISKDTTVSVSPSSSEFVSMTSTSSNLPSSALDVSKTFVLEDHTSIALTSIALTSTVVPISTCPTSNAVISFSFPPELSHSQFGDVNDEEGSAEKVGFIVGIIIGSVIAVVLWIIAIIMGFRERESAEMLIIYPQNLTQSEEESMDSDTEQSEAHADGSGNVNEEEAVRIDKIREKHRPESDVKRSPSMSEKEAVMSGRSSPASEKEMTGSRRSSSISEKESMVWRRSSSREENGDWAYRAWLNGNATRRIERIPVDDGMQRTREPEFIRESIDLMLSVDSIWA